jgi:hypothetical protein
MITVKYHETYNKEQLDSAFFVDGLGAVVASVSDGNRSLDVRCVGEMRVLYPERSVVLRYASDLIEVGIDTDKKLQEFTDYWQERGIEVWANNSWFELFDFDEPEAYDIAHSLDEAVDACIRILTTEEKE